MTFEIDGFTPIDILGHGGFGTVHRAADDAHGREVAVKVLGRITDDSARRRFDRERRAMGTLSGHPTIGIVYTSGFTKNEEPYIVMEMIRGGSLADRLDKDGPLPAGEVRQLGITLAEALDHAHDGGVLHLDLKPENILMSRFGQPKIVDFGIAALIDDESATSTIRATPSFADPDVLDGHPGTEQSDVYGLAATLFTLLDGAPPYSAGSSGLYQMMRRVAMDPVPMVERAGVPREFAELLRRAMAKSPADRPQTMREFAELLNAVTIEEVSGQPVPHQPIPHQPIPHQPIPHQPVAQRPAPQPTPQQHAPRPAPPIQSVDAPDPLQGAAAAPKQRGGMGAIVTLSSLAVVLAAVLAFLLIQRNTGTTEVGDPAAPVETLEGATLEQGGETSEPDTTLSEGDATPGDLVPAVDGQVPRVVGMTTAEASQTLVDSGFQVSEPAHCFDIVASQSPAAGTQADPGTAVALGYPQCVVPQFVGERLDEAKRIVNEDFVVGLLISWPSHCDDLVLDQNIAAGEIVEPGTRVLLTLEDEC